MTQLVPKVLGVTGFAATPSSYKASALNLVGGATMSVAALIRGDLLENYPTARCIFGNWDGSHGWQIRADTNRIGWEIRDGADSTQQCYSQNYPTNPPVARKLILCVGTYSGTTMRFYMNAQLVGSTTVTAGITAATGASRATFGTNSNDAEAAIDMTILGGAYTAAAALTQAQVSALYEACCASAAMVDGGAGFVNMWEVRRTMTGGIAVASWVDIIGAIALAKQGAALALASGVANWL